MTVTTREFLQQAIAKSRGTSNRQKIKRDAFLDIEVRWPDVETRKQKVSRLLEVAERTASCVQAVEAEFGALATLPQNFLEHAFEF